MIDPEGDAPRLDESVTRLKSRRVLEACVEKLEARVSRAEELLKDIKNTGCLSDVYGDIVQAFLDKVDERWEDRKRARKQRKEAQVGGPRCC